MEIQTTDISELMSIYEKLYADQESRLNDSLDRATRALHFQPIDRYPIWQVSQTTLYPRHELFHDPEKNLITGLYKNILSLRHKTDYVPYLDPFEGVTILAEAFGCERRIMQDGDPAVKEPIIYQPSDVYNLKKPGLDHPVFQRVFDTLKLWSSKTGNMIPIGTTDPQSPLDVLELLWDTNTFYICLYENPKEIHYLLDIITETFIEFYSKQLEIIPNPAFPVHLFPLLDSNDGIAVSDDQTINMTPEFFREYELPCLNRIAEAFGGMYFHSCGNFGPFIEDITTITNLRAINCHLSPNEFKPSYIRKVTGKNIGLFLGISDVGVGWNNPKWDMHDFIDLYHNYYLPAVLTNNDGTGMALVGYGSYRGYFDPFAKRVEGGKLIDQRGRPVEDDPLIDVSLEEKNRNFDTILHTIEELNQRIAAGEDITDTETYRYYNDPD